MLDDETAFNFSRCMVQSPSSHSEGVCLRSVEFSSLYMYLEERSQSKSQDMYCSAGPLALLSDRHSQLPMAMPTDDDHQHIGNSQHGLWLLRSTHRGCSPCPSYSH